MTRPASVVLLSLVALAACETDNPVAGRDRPRFLAGRDRPSFSVATPTYRVLVNPKGTTVADAPTWTLSYSVQNQSNVTATFSITCSALGCDSVTGSALQQQLNGPPTVILAAGQSVPLTGYFHRFDQCYKDMAVYAQGVDPGNTAQDRGYYVSNPCPIPSSSGSATMQPGNMCYYTPSASGGSPPYTFTWSWHSDPSASVFGQPQSNGTFLLVGEGGSGNIYLTMTATDALGAANSANMTVAMSEFYSPC